MPPIPKKKTVKQIAVRYWVRRVDDIYWAVAYDQSGRRYPEADYKETDREHVCKVARERVNKSYSSPVCIQGEGQMFYNWKKPKVTEKSKEITDFLQDEFKVDLPKALEKSTCVEAPIGCGGPALKFKDDKSRREYMISGLCQTCQDKIFGDSDALV